MRALINGVPHFTCCAVWRRSTMREKKPPVANAEAVFDHAGSRLNE
ncbi:hypothetical protein [Actimicrobium sp. CCI2.3]|nr:hypothetical protein [Actimicrobium sp. CCI2.3]MEB0022639.1 hypothetical protein [Actimicrobium sp. CCI2.3]